MAIKLQNVLNAVHQRLARLVSGPKETPRSVDSQDWKLRAAQSGYEVRRTVSMEELAKLAQEIPEPARPKAGAADEDDLIVPWS